MALSTESISDFQKFQTTAMTFDNGELPRAFVSIEKERGKAYRTVLSLVREGYFEKAQEWVDFSSDAQKKALELALRYFTPGDSLENLSQEERALCMRIHNNQREYKLRGKLSLQKPDESLVRMGKFSTKVAKVARKIDGAVAVGEALDLIDTEGMPMSLGDFKRIYPDKHLDINTISSLLEGSSTPLSKEVVDHLQSRAIAFIPKDGGSERFLRGAKEEAAERVGACAEPLIAGSFSSTTPSIEQKEPLHQPSTFSQSQKDSFIVELKATLERAEHLNRQLEEHICRGESLPPQLVGEIQQLTEQVESSLKPLEKAWENRGEYFQKAMQCVATVTQQIYETMRYAREERGLKSAFKREREAFDDRKRQLYAGLNLSGDYGEIDHFVHDHFDPRGAITDSLIEIKTSTDHFLHHMERLDARRGNLRSHNLKLKAHKDILEKEDRERRKKAEQEIKRQQKIAKRIRHVSIFLQTTIAIFGVCKENAACAAAGIATGAAGQAAQEGMAGKIDRRVSAYQRGERKSLRRHEDLAQAAASNLHQLSVVEQQIGEGHHLLLTRPDLFSSQGVRKGLQKLIATEEEQLKALRETRKTQDEELGRAKGLVDYEQGQVSHWFNKKINTMDSDKEATYERRVEESKRARDAAIIDRDEKQRLLDATDAAIDELEGELSNVQERLNEELFLAPMKEQIEGVILSEQKWSDYEREESGKLTQKGVAQRQMRINYARYNEARMIKRYLAQSGFQATKGLSLELCRAMGSRKPVMAVDLGEQLFRLYDLHKHFKENALPQFHTFLRSLNLSDSAGLKEKVKALQFVELMSGFVIPGIQVAAAAATALRLIYSMATEESRLSPEQQFLLDALQHTFTEHHKQLDKKLNALQKNLNRNHSKLQKELEAVKSGLASVGRELSLQMERMEEKLLDAAHSESFNEYKSSIERLAREWREENRRFIQALQTGPRTEQQLRRHVKTLHAWLDHAIEPDLNGLTRLTGSQWKPRFDLQYIAASPDYATALLWQQVKGEATPFPNLILFGQIQSSLRQLEAAIPENSAVAEELEDLQGRLREYSARLILLQLEIPRAIERARSARSDYIASISKAVGKMGKFGRVCSFAVAQRQTHALLHTAKDRLLDKERVGVGKFLLNRAVHEIALGNEIDRHQLRSLDQRLDYRVGLTFAVPGAVGMTTFYAPFLALACGFVASLPITATLAAGMVVVPAMVMSAGTTAKHAYNYFGDEEKMRGDEAAKIIDAMKKPLSSFDAAGYFREKPQHWRVDGDNKRALHDKLTYDSAFCPVDLRYKITSVTRSFTYSPGSDSFQGEPFEVWDKGETVGKGKKLVHCRVSFAVNFEEVKNRRLSACTYERTFADDSFLKERHITKISSLLPPKDYELRHRKMIEGYIEYVEHLSKVETLPEEHPLHTINNESQLIPSHSGELLPMPFSKKLLREIEKRRIPDLFALMAHQKVALSPHFHFEKLEDEEVYSLQLLFHLVRPGVQASGEFLFREEVARFPKEVVELFAKIDLTQEASGGKNPSKGALNLQEFLIQSAIGSYYGIGLPGKGTLHVEEGMYAVVEVPFAGWYKLLRDHPEKSLHYDISFDGRESASLMRSVQNYAVGGCYLQLWLEGQKNRDSEAQRSNEKQRYRECYFRAKALDRLFSDLDEESFEKFFHEKNGLSHPDQSEKVESAALLQFLSGSKSKFLR